MKVPHFLFSLTAALLLASNPAKGSAQVQILELNSITDQNLVQLSRSMSRSFVYSDGKRLIVCPVTTETQGVSLLILSLHSEKISADPSPVCQRWIATAINLQTLDLMEKTLSAIDEPNKKEMLRKLAQRIAITAGITPAEFDSWRLDLRSFNSLSPAEKAAIIRQLEGKQINSLHQKK